MKKYILVTISFILALSSSVWALTEYYVSYTVDSSGDGSSTWAWKTWGDINWTTINMSLSSGPVTIYLDSRAEWPPESHEVVRNDSSSNRLTIAGDLKYLSGDGTWLNETVHSHRAKFSAGGGTIYLKGTNPSFITIRGIFLDQPAWGGVDISPSHNTTNKHDITIENLKIVNPAHNHGIYSGGMTTGFYNFVVKDNYIEGTPLEGIYVGQYDYLEDTITGVVVEGNTLVDTGSRGEGDIDIKPGCYGAIVRNNVHYSTQSAAGASCGVVVAADNCQIYNNKFFNLKQKDTGDWGFGIYLNADGSGSIGKNITSCLIYNNVIYCNNRAGIKVSATKSGYTMSGVKILNNTIVGNGTQGIQISASSTTVSIDSIQNNIIANNIGYDISISGDVSIRTCDYNNYYRLSGISWKYHGSDMTWSEWRSLGLSLIHI